MPYDNLDVDPNTDALLAVDVQPTFMPGGGLAVTGGDQVVRPIAELATCFPAKRRIATRDLHPPGHVSLASSYCGCASYSLLTLDDARAKCGCAARLAPQARFTRSELAAYLSQVGQQVLWPDHGLPGTDESELHPYLARSGLFPFVFPKGLDPACDSYSAFSDNLKRPTHLADYLRALGVKRVFIAGLAYDYCVGFTALDAVQEGFQAVVVMAATRSVAPDSELAMTKRLIQAGVALMVAGKDPDRATTP